MKFEIFVTLKKEVLDPQGKVVEGAIKNLGLTNISNILRQQSSQSSASAGSRQTQQGQVTGLIEQ